MLIRYLKALPRRLTCEVGSGENNGIDGKDIILGVRLRTVKKGESPVWSPGKEELDFRGYHGRSRSQRGTNMCYFFCERELGRWQIKTPGRAEVEQ